MWVNIANFGLLWHFIISNIIFILLNPIFFMKFQSVAFIFVILLFIIRSRHQLVFYVGKDWTSDLLFNH